MAGTKLDEAKRAIVQFVREGNLSPGDRLPSHAALREKLNLGTATVNNAINELRLDGVLEARHRVGVFVKDPVADGHIGRSIGVIAFDTLDHSAFCNHLINIINVLLTQHGYLMRLFCCHHGVPVEKRLLSSVAGLRRVVHNHEVDALFAITEIAPEAIAELEAWEVPLVTFCTYPQSANSLGLDYCGYATNVLREAFRRGCRNVALWDNAVTKHFEEAIQGMEPDFLQQCHYGFFADNGRGFADRIMAMPPAARPDCIVSVNDVSLLDFTLELARRRHWSYQPLVAWLRNTHFPIDLPFERQLTHDVDSRKLAEFIAEHIVARVKNATSWSEPNLYPLSGEC